MSYLEIARESLNQLRGEEFSGLSADSTPVSDASMVGAMRLVQFASAGLIVRVYVSGWGRDVLLVSDNVPEAQFEGRPEVVYRAHEIKKLERCPPAPQHQRTVQMVLDIFGGTIRDVCDRTEPNSHGEVSDAANG